MGAGLILDGRLYSGTNDMAGEVGHVRLADDGPIGYGKAGSFEGFCSGGGIARLAQARAREALADGTPPLFCATPAALDGISAATVAEAAHQGDALALEIYATVARRLGQGLALLIDVLNPQRIILGSIYLRQQALIEPVMRAELAREALSHAADVCAVVPAGLGESIGDYAALAIAFTLIQPQATRTG
jgi:glucokinase